MHAPRGGDAPASRPALRALEDALEAAYRGDPAHSLLANLASVRDGEWHDSPAGGTRSIAGIVEHVGWAKHMYHDYAFGSGTLDGRSLAPPGRDRVSMLAWLEAGHAAFAQAVAALASDDELERSRMTNWGELRETRTLIWIVIAHDTFHAGEINHARALLRGDDRWPYDPAPSE